jgi:hypothetical protein
MLSIYMRKIREYYADQYNIGFKYQAIEITKGQHNLKLRAILDGEEYVVLFPLPGLECRTDSSPTLSTTYGQHYLLSVT